MRLITVVVTLLALPLATVQSQDREVIRVPGMLPDTLPFSSAVRAGEFLFLSGQIGWSPQTRTLVGGGIGPETRQTMENIKATLEYAGSSMDRIVKCTVFLADMADYQAMNEVYATYFGPEPPARSAFAARALALGARVEIDCTALTAAG